MAKPKHDDPPAFSTDKVRGRFKRPFDLLIIGVALVLGLPLWIVLFPTLALLVYFDSGRPILFKCPRVGRDGLPFEMYKFRTMEQGAEHRGPPITRRNDPRITRVGRFLRSTGLDELPQLWSVCKGDMSLVGPRPYNLRSHDYYLEWSPRFARRLQVRPGLAGPAALWGSTSDPANRLAWDLAYVRNQSMCWDAILLVRCALIVFVAGWERKQDETSAPVVGARKTVTPGRRGRVT